MERNLFDGWVTLRARKHPKMLNGLAETLSEFELSANVIKANNDSSGRIDRNKAIDFYLRDDFFSSCVLFTCRFLEWKKITQRF